jgi:hypothetical protein
MPKILTDVLSRLSPDLDEIIGEVFVNIYDSLTTDQIFCIYQVMDKNNPVEQYIGY